MLPRSFAYRLALIVAVGVAIRIVYTVLVAPWPPWYPDDSEYFHRLATLLANGHGFTQPFPQAAWDGPTAYHPPLYPVLLAGVAKLGGNGDVVQRLTGSLFGAGTIAAVGLLARRLRDDRTGLIAAALAALYPMLITADGALMSESLYGLLVALSLLAAYRLLEAPSAGRAVVLGVLVGLAALTRGEALAFLLLVLIPVVRRPHGARAALVACIAVAVALAPWTIRNWIVFDQFIPIATNSGTTIAGSNCGPVYSGKDIGRWNLLCARPSSGDEAEQTAVHRRDGVRYALDHAGRLPVVIAAREARVWSLYQPGITMEGRAPWAQNVGLVAYYLLIPFAIYGFVLLRRRRIPVWILMTPFLVVVLTAALFYGWLRFREPAEISLVVLAGVAIDGLWTRIREARSGALESRMRDSTATPPTAASTTSGISAR